MNLIIKLFGKNESSCCDVKIEEVKPESQNSCCEVKIQEVKLESQSSCCA